MVLLQALAHPHIAALYGIACDGVFAYAVMELGPRGDLYEYIAAEKSLPEAATRKIVYARESRCAPPHARIRARGRGGIRVTRV